MNFLIYLPKFVSDFFYFSFSFCFAVGCVVFPTFMIFVLIFNLFFTVIYLMINIGKIKDYLYSFNLLWLCIIGTVFDSRKNQAIKDKKLKSKIN